MDQVDIERLQDAVQALNEGELDPFVSLVGDDTIWTGQSRGWLWWRHSNT